MSSPEKILKSLLSEALKKDEGYQAKQGCKLLKQATIDLENVVRASLDPASKLEFSFNSKNELIATWEGSDERIMILNVSSILKQSPDFEHITLHILKNQQGEPIIKDDAIVEDESILQLYAEYVKQTGAFKPKLKSGDLRAETSLMDVPENIALNIYTGKHFKEINNFLRCSGTLPTGSNGWNWDKVTNKALEGDALQIRIQDILYAAVVASNGLNRRAQTKSGLDSVSDLDLGFRRDIVNGKEPYFTERLEKFAKAASSKIPVISTEKSFYSSSDFGKESEFIGDVPNSYTLIIRGQTSKSIEDVSKHQSEKEALPPPGAEFRCLAYKKQPALEPTSNKLVPSHFFVIAEHNQIDTNLEPQQLENHQKIKREISPVSPDKEDSTGSEEFQFDDFFLVQFLLNQ